MCNMDEWPLSPSTNVNYGSEAVAGMAAIGQYRP
jgi:hypothetical protein